MEWRPCRNHGCTTTRSPGLRGEIDGDAIEDAWRRVLAAPDHDGPPVWSHGDLSYLNLLAVDGTLSAVIDWGHLRCRRAKSVLVADKIHAIEAVLADGDR